MPVVSKCPRTGSVYRGSIYASVLVTVSAKPLALQTLPDDHVQELLDSVAEHFLRHSAD